MLLGACAKVEAPIRPIGEDPVALVPSGADAIIDVDVDQLRVWPDTKRFLSLLPPAAQQRLLGLGFDPLEDVEALTAAIYDLGRPNQRTLLLVKTQLELDRFGKDLGGDPQLVDHRGARLLEGTDRSVGRVTGKIVVLGPRAEVRRALDLARGDGESARSEKMLMAAWGRCPTAKVGRPAILMALTMRETVKEELRRQDLPGVDTEWLALSFAVGDGFDVGAIAAVRGPGEAKQMVVTGLRRKEEFARTRAAKLLGLRTYLDPLVMVALENEVHFVYRLPGTTVDRMLTRLESLMATPPTPPPTAPPALPPSIKNGRGPT
jgi:hypothetical protein